MKNKSLVNFLANFFIKSWVNFFVNFFNIFLKKSLASVNFGAKIATNFVNLRANFLAKISTNFLAQFLAFGKALARVKIPLFLLSFCLCFGAFESELANFDKNFADANKAQQQRFHNQLKALNIQSTLNKDNASKEEILKRLIISSKALRLDYGDYESEYKALKMAREGAFADTSSNAENAENGSKNSQNLAINSINPATSQKNSQDLAKDAEKNSQKLFVLSSKKEKNGVLLNLNDNISQKDIKIMELKESKNHRYIFDFEASLDKGRKDFDFDEIKITLAQFNPQITRLVLNSKSDIKYQLEVKNKAIILEFFDEKGEKNSQNPAKANQNTSEKKSVNLSKNSAKNSINSNANLKQISKNSQKEAPLYVLKSVKDKNGVKLHLSREIDDDELKKFTMNDKGIKRQIVNFEGVLEGSRKDFYFDKDILTLSQYSPKIVRVVLNSPNNFELDLENDGKILFLGFDKTGFKSSQKTSIKNSQKTTNSNSKTANANQNSSKTAAPKRSNFKQTPINTSKKVVVIDAGHGGKDGGAVNGKLLEKDIVLKVALKTGEELRKKGFAVHYTRTNDRYINLRDRTKLANDKKASLFISIHANAAINKNKAKTANGIETFFLSPARSERSKEVAALENQADLEEANYFSKQNFLHSLSREKIIASNRLAIDIQKHTLAAVRQKFKILDGGVREAPFWVLVGAQDMPAVLVEIGYISHPTESKRLNSRTYQDLLADGIAAGIINYFKNNDNE